MLKDSQTPFVLMPNKYLLSGGYLPAFLHQRFIAETSMSPRLRPRKRPPPPAKNKNPPLPKKKKTSPKPKPHPKMKQTIHQIVNIFLMDFGTHFGSKWGPCWLHFRLQKIIETLLNKDVWRHCIYVQSDHRFERTFGVMQSDFGVVSFRNSRYL